MSVSSLLYPNDFNVYSNFNTSNASFTKSINGVDGGSLLVGDDSPNIFIGNDAVPHNNVYINGVLISPPFGSIDTIGPVGAAPNANGGLITANVLTLEPASATFPGVLTAIAQSIAGVKTFTDNIKMSIGKAILSPANTQWLWSGPFSDTTSIYGGANAGWVTNNTNHHNVGFGHLALQNATSSTDCVAFGESCLGNLSTGNNVIALGSNAGSAYSTESNNIVINNPGIVADSGHIRIGTNGTHTACAISGIYSNVIGSPQVCVIDSNSNMGSATIASIAGVTTMAAIGAVPNANGATISGNTLTLQPASASFGGVLTSAAQTIAGLKTFNLGVKLATGASVQNPAGFPILWTGPFGSNTDIFIGANAGNTAFAGSQRLSGVGQNALLLCTTGTDNTAIGANTLSSLLTGIDNIALGCIDTVGSGSAYTGVESNNICIGNAGVIADSGRIRLGTVGTHTNCQVAGIYGNSPGSPQVVVSDSNGNLGSQTIASIAGVTTMAAIGAAPNANGALISGNTLTLEPASASFGGVLTTGAQTIAGVKTMNNGIQLPAGQSIIGLGGFPILWQGAFGTTPDIYVGRSAGSAQQSLSARNTGIGRDSMLLATNSTDNTAVGYSSLSAILTGAGNVALGSGAGSAYASTEANNICIKNTGVVADSGVIRMGTSGTHTTCFIQGISGNTPGSPQVVTIGTGGQLGSATIASVSGVTTMAAVGSAPNANGALISGNTLTLEPADATNPGVLSNTTQSILGAKTWVSDASFSSNVNMVKTANPTATAGILNIAGSRYLHTSGTGSSPTNVFLGLNSSNIGVSNTSANCNGIGQGVLGSLTSGNSNNCLGSGAGSAITGGSFNTCIGQDAGSAISATSANSIMINAIGSGSDTAVTRIGTHGTQTKAFMAGIIGNAAAASTSAVVCADTATSQLGTLTFVQNAAYTTGNMTCGATINTLTVRGGAVLTPFPYPITYSQIGNVIYIRLPAFQVSSVTGTPGTTIVLAAAGTVPAGLRPSLADCSMACPAQNGGVYSTSMYKVAITVAGAVNLIGSTTFTTNFGLQEDTVLVYNI